MLSFDEFTRHVLAELEVPLSTFNRETELNELGLDSLDAFEVIVLAEQLAGFDPDGHPSNREASTFHPIFSLGDVYEYYLGITGERL